MVKPPSRETVGGDLTEQIVKSIDEALEEVFGSVTKEAVIHHLRLRGLTLEDAVKRPRDFIRGLQEIFGAGSQVLERRFIINIQLDLSVRVSADDLDTLLDRIRKLKGDIGSKGASTSGQKNLLEGPANRDRFTT
jgi:hypothetical protein